MFSTLNNGLPNRVAYLFTGGSSAASCTGAAKDCFLRWAMDTILGLFTVWIMFQGYLILTGQSSASLSAFMMKALKIFIVITIATSVTGPIFGKSILRFFGDMSDGITHVVTGQTVNTADNEIPGSGSFSVIDNNLRLMQAGLSAIKAIDTADNQALEDEKNRALWMSTAGIAGPGIVAGVLLLLNKVALALFIAFAPLFILCYGFKVSEQMFWSWLKFGISSLFALAILSFMTGLAMDMVARLAGVVFVSDLLGTNTQGVTNAAMQQGGLGLILSTLLITVPPMAGNFFSNALGQYSAYSVFGGNGSLQEQKQAGSAGGGSYGGGAVVQSGRASQNNDPVRQQTGALTVGATHAYSPPTDTIKSHSMMGNASQVLPQPMLQSNSAGASFNADSIKGMGDDSIAVKQKYNNNLLTTPQKAEA